MIKKIVNVKPFIGSILFLFKCLVFQENIITNLNNQN